MANSNSPEKIMFGGMIIAAMSFKLKQDYIYLSYAAIAIGLMIFIIGVVKHFQQKNKYW